MDFQIKYEDGTHMEIEADSYRKGRAPYSRIPFFTFYRRNIPVAEIHGGNIEWIVRIADAVRIYPPGETPEHKINSCVAMGHSPV